MRGYRVRHMLPADVAALERLNAAQNAALGTNCLTPQVFTADGNLLRRIPLALVVERDGRVQQVNIFECQPELMTFGMDPRATAAALPYFSQAEAVLAEQGYSGFHALVPEGHFARHWEHSFGKRVAMQYDSDRLAHYFKTLGATR